MMQFIPDKTGFPHDIIEGIKEVLEGKVEFALLFGSAVIGRMTPESDNLLRGGIYA